MLLKLSSLPLLFLIIIAFSSCQPCIDGHGEIVSEVRVLDDFSYIEVEVPADVYIHVGEFQKVSIQTNTNIINNIRTNVSGSALIIESEPCIGSTDKFRIDIVVTELEGVDISGSATVKTSKSIIKSDDFKIRINGSGDLDMEINANYLNAKINGSGSIKLKGSTEELKLKINGSGEFYGQHFLSEDVTVVINGSGDVQVNATKSIDASISGSGEVRYIGDPRKIKTDVSGSGEVKKIK